MANMLRQCDEMDGGDGQEIHGYKLALGASDNVADCTSRRRGLPILHCKQEKFSGGCLSVLGKMNCLHHCQGSSFFEVRNTYYILCIC